MFKKFASKLKLFLNNNKVFLLFFTISLIVFSVWLIAFYPGSMSPDSEDQWMQAAKGLIGNHHPYFHTLLIQVMQKIWYNPAFIALTQIVIASFLGAYFLSYLVKKGLNKIIAILLLGFYLLSPSIGYYNIALWKDIPFSLGIFALSIIFVVSSIEGFPKSKFRLILLVLLTVGVSFLRHNGIFIILLIPITFYAFKIFTLKRTLTFLILTLVGFVFLNNILFTVLKIGKSNFITTAPLLHIVGGVVSSGYELTEDERVVLEKLIPIENLKERYDCRVVNPIIFNNPDFNSIVLKDDQYKSEFDQLSISIILRNLPSAISNRFCAFFNVVGINRAAFMYDEPGNEPTEFVENYKIPVYKETQLSRLLYRYVTYTVEKDLTNLVFWNVSPYILITLIVAMIRRNKYVLGYTIISLFNLIPLFAGGVGGDYRFIYSIHITGIFVIALLLLPKSNTGANAV